MLIVRGNVKKLAILEGKKFSVSGNFYEELNRKVEKIVGKACFRAKENGRTTLMARDV